MESGEYEDGMVVEFSANGNSMNAIDVAAKLDEGNIQEAESSLREGLSLNFEVISCISLIGFILVEKRSLPWPFELQYLFPSYKRGNCDLVV